jgi:hypothetical protein
MVLGTVACGDDDGSTKPTPMKPDDPTSGGKGGGKAGTKAPPTGGTTSTPPPDAGKPLPDAGKCPVDTSTAEQRFEQMCKNGHCPMTLDDLPTVLDDDAGCSQTTIECCGVVTVTQFCHLYFEGWTFDRETKRLIGVSYDDDVEEPCQGDHTGGMYVRDCGAALSMGLCDGMDGGT